MLTLTLIIIVLLYFFIRTWMWKKEQHLAWKRFGEVEEWETLQGTVTHLFRQRRHFTSDWWYMQVEMTLYVHQEQQNIPVIWKRPHTKQMHMPELKKRMKVRVKGRRLRGVFHANRMIPLNGGEECAKTE